MPLNRDVCLRDEVDDAVDDVDVEGATPPPISMGYLLPADVGLPSRISTTMSALLVILGLPSSMFFASTAPAWVLNLSMADRKPGSSDWSGGRTSISRRSFENVIITRRVSSEVLMGRRRIRAEDTADGTEDAKGIIPTGMVASRSKAIERVYVD